MRLMILMMMMMVLWHLLKVFELSLVHINFIPSESRPYMKLLCQYDNGETIMLCSLIKLLCQYDDGETIMSDKNNVEQG